MAGNQGNSRKKTTHNMHNEKKYKNPAGQERVREKSSRAKSDAQLIKRFAELK